MARSTGWVLAAAAITGANEALFVPAETGKPPDFTAVWRLIPAAGLLALALAGLETLAPEFAVGLARLLVVGVLVFPVGNAPAPLDSVNKLLGYK